MRMRIMIRMMLAGAALTRCEQRVRGWAFSAGHLGMASFVVHRGTADFPLSHTFVDANHSGDPRRELIRVSMTDFVAFLGQSAELQL